MRRPILIVITCCALGAALACSRGSAELQTLGQPKSIVMILIDTLRSDHMSLYGSERTTTPFLDGLARESIVFGNAYAPASWTRASVASLFSSRIPESHGCEGRDGMLSSSVVTLAEALAAEGYEARGVVANGNVLPRHGLDQGFVQYDFIKDYPDYPYADALEMIEPVADALGQLGPGPHFVYLHYVDPHDPYTPHHDADFDPDYTGPMDGSREQLEPFGFKRPPEAEAQRTIDLYDGEILWFDRQLEHVFSDLEARGLLDESWVVIVSDHGEGLWDHGVMTHGADVFQEQLRVPLIIRPPGGLRSGHLWIDEQISLIDVAPTLLECVGLAQPEDFEGRSWASFLDGREEAPVRPVVIDEELQNVNLAAIVDGDHKLIVDFNRNRRHLYDLATNPREEPEGAIDLQQTHSEVGTRLWRELDRALSRARERRPNDNVFVEEDPEQLEILRRMGYIDDETDAVPRDDGRAGGVEPEGADDGPDG